MAWAASRNVIKPQGDSEAAWTIIGLRTDGSKVLGAWIDAGEARQAVKVVPVPAVRLKSPVAGC